MRPLPDRCPCGRTSRRGGIYCGPCARGADALPADHGGAQAEFDASLARIDGRDRRQELARWAVQIEWGQEAQRRKEALLEERLTRQQRVVWRLVVKGASERQIAARLSCSRQFLYEHLLGPLLQRAGLPSRPVRYPAKRAEAGAGEVAETTGVAV